jgi:hypothetical protein
MAPTSTFLGESEIENRYFRNFQRTAAMGLDGIWGWYFWNHLMLQNSHHEPFIWHSIIAIGALLKFHESSHSAGVHALAGIIPDVARLHRQFAIAKYGAAVKLMQKAIDVGTTNPRQALLGCLIVVCFEILLGNRRTALGHARSGSLILQQWRVKIQTPEKKPLQLLSPAPLTVEDEIVGVFQTLVAQISMSGDHDSANCSEVVMEFHDHMMEFHDRITTRVPEAFTNLREAQAFLSLVVGRIYQFGRKIRSQYESRGLGKEHDPEPRL